MSTFRRRFFWSLPTAASVCLTILLLGAILTPIAPAALPDEDAGKAASLSPQVDDPFYPDYSDVVSQLQDLATSYPAIASFHVIGQETHGTRNIVALKISDNVSSEEDEPTWAFTGFVHGKEQLGLAVLLRLAEELVTDYGAFTDITNWVDAYEIWIVIMLNPWGYDHDSDGSSLVTGTRKNGPDTGVAGTSGVDLARNYDFVWGGCGSANPDDSEFMGPAAFSENETQAIRDFFVEQRPIFGITFHQGNPPDGGQIMRPWSGSGSDAPPDGVRLEEIANLYADWVLDSRDDGPFCSSILEDPDGEAGCDDPRGTGDGSGGGDIEYCADLCWEPEQATLGRCGQPSNWYYHEVGTFDYTVEITDRGFNGDFMHSASGPGNDDEQAVQDIAYEFAFNHWQAIKAWLDYFLYSTLPTFRFTGPGLTGHITDALLGTPLAATVEISGYTSSLIEDRTSDHEFGRYWRLLPAGSHHVTVSKPGYQPWEGDVTVGSGALTELDVALTPDLEIILPNSTYVAWVGEPDDTRTFTVRLRLGSAGAPCVGPLPFEVFVRDETATWIEANTGAQACVQDSYWISVQAPDSGDGSFLTDGIYDLRVVLDTVADESAAAVRYTDREEDTILVMDVSGSMGSGGKLAAAQEAAMLLVHELADTDQGALVWFSGNGSEPGRDADTARELAPMNAGNQTLLINAISSLTLRNRTSIGDGLDEALDESESTRADPDHYCGLVLLSDGMENEAAYWSDVQARAAESPCAIHVVALGPETDEVLLEEISQKGTPGTTDDGSYHYATIEDTVTRMAGVESVLADWPNRLAGIYDDIATRLAQRQRFFKALNRVGRTPRDHTVNVDATIDRVVFALKWSGADAAGRLELRQPDGTLITPATPGVSYRSTLTHEVYRITKPMPGAWKARVINLKPQQEENLPYVLVASGETFIEFQVFTSADVAPVHQGEAVHILGVLTAHGQSIIGADVRTTITAPDGASSTLRLFDDGLHADGAANDGFYANVYDRTIAGDQVDPKRPEGEGLQVVGSYDLEAIAQTAGVVRITSGSFTVIPSPDSDKDGMPDPWEIAHGLNPKADDAQADPDMDGLTNVGEFLAGTDPRDSDTDDGGESDDSEADAGRDPLWPADDTIAPIAGFSVSPLPNGARVTWTPDSSHVVYRLFRRRQVGGAWQLIDSQVPPTGTYDDHGLTNNITYEYMLVALGQQQQRSGNSPIRSVTPVADPFPPQGSVRINNGAQVAATRRVELTLQADADTKNMRLGSEMDEGTGEVGGAWRSFQARLDWLIPVEIGSGQTWTIYAQLRDAAGNESAVFTDAIRYQPGCYDFYSPPGVGMGDIQFAASRWHTSSPGVADLNGDGQENIVDIMTVAAWWGWTCP